MKYIVDCRALSVGMGNLIKFVRHEISSVSPELSESDAKSKLLETLTSFNEEKMLYAWKSIVSYHSQLINPGDTILTYGYSTAVIQVSHIISNHYEFDVTARADSSGRSLFDRLHRHHRR